MSCVCRVVVKFEIYKKKKKAKFKFERSMNSIIVETYCFVFEEKMDFCEFFFVRRVRLVGDFSLIRLVSSLIDFFLNKN